MIRKRDVFRRIPFLGALARRLDALEAENGRLRRYLWESTVTDVAALRETASGEWGPNGLPVPPGMLRYLVSGTDDPAWFLRSGQLAMVTVTDALQKNGLDPSRVERMLDFGCGCGRVLRHFDQSWGGRLHGADRNPLAIEWCRRHLPFAQFELAGPEPPLPYADRHFDVIYAFSVFTHLALDAQAPWMDEMRRLLRPLGCLVLSVHGDSYSKHLPREDRVEYRRGRAVVLAEDAEGSNLFNAFHPEAYVRSELSKGFEVVEFTPRGARGNPTQDLYLLRKVP